MIDVVRLWLGILVAVALPLGLPARHTNIGLRCLFTAAYAAYAIFPALLFGTAIATWFGVVAIGVAAQIGVRRRASTAEQTPDRDDLARMAHRIWQSHRQVVYVLAGLLLLLPVVAAVHFGGRSLDELGRLLADDRVAIIVSGLLFAVFTGGDFVAATVRPLIRRLAERGADIHQIVPTSAYIGWIERTLVFTFVAGGHPEAAALAIAAKSLTRLPNVDQHPSGFGEYVLVGTLSSLLVASMTAVVVRLALGLSPV